MYYRLLLLLTFLGTPRVFYAQTQPDIKTALAIYTQQTELFLREIKVVRKMPLKNRVASAAKQLDPQQLFTAISLFNKAWDTKAALLFYFHDGKSLQVFLMNERGIVHSSSVRITRDSLLAIETNIRHAIGVYTNLSLNRGMDSRGIGLHPSVRKGDSAYLRSVTGLLIDTAMAKLLLVHSHLLVCPTLNLYSFPFAALRPFSDDRYLGTVLPISILPNLYELAAKKYTESPISFRSQVSKATLVGGPIFNSYVKPEDYYGRNKTIHEFFLGELPYTIEQTNAVKELLLEDSTGRIRIDFLQGLNAVLPNVQRSVADADLIYIATHAFAASLYPWDSSFIAFARESKTQKPGKNFWTNRSVCNSSFKARLAVLSACQTGTGQLWNAGIISLGNSFYYAGVEQVVSTLWNIDDRSTYMYMREFMKSLLSGERRHPAYWLHVMQKKTQFSVRHWAGFICFGI